MLAPLTKNGFKMDSNEKDNSLNKNNMGLSIAIGGGIGLVFGQFIFGNPGIGLVIGAGMGIALSRFKSK